MRMVLWVSSIIVATAMGCQQELKYKLPKGNQDSAKSTLQSYIKAVHCRDLDDIHAYIEPEIRADWARVLFWCREYYKTTDSIESLLQDQFSEDIANRFHETLLTDLFEENLQGAAKKGVINWERLQLIVKNDSCQVTVDEKEISVLLKKIAGKWYIVFQDEHSQLKDGHSYECAFIRELLKEYKKIEKALQNGRINKDNVEAVLFFEGPVP